MVDTPLDRLLEIGYADLHKNQAEFKRVAAEVDASKTPDQVLAELATMHPAPEQLLNSFRATFDGLIAFHSREAHHHHSFGCAADSRGDAALHAGYDLRLDGYAGCV